MLYEVESAPGEMALNEIRAELKSQGYLKYYKQRDRKQKPADFLRYTSSDGFEILVGRNNLQNDKLTLHTPAARTCVPRPEGTRQPLRRYEPRRGHPRHDQTGGRRAGRPAFEPERRCKGRRGHHRGQKYMEANGAKPGMVLYESTRRST